MTSSGMSALVEWVTGLMETLGAPGAGIAVALENLFPPIPSEVILPLAGFTVSQGDLVFWHVLVWTTLGSVVGALALYAVGALLGRERVHALFAKVPLLKPEDVEKSEDWFARHGRKTVFFGRMVPVFRSLISVPAGFERMPLPTFTLFTTMGSLIWNTALVTAGYFLGRQWSIVETYVGIFTYVVIGLVVLAVAVFVWKRVRERRESRQS
ncbi:DedA family protein [Nonomuraea sp. MCN248]|uniref:DedA family protein n=1 Tax=Nonomuraea corallina TaxID=2989783 RepID=A0ABT4SL59_9ACTN|nr:DedA family protein [Nonomuraea corallina]MDA0637952.1 DedA family protein [Nonomuraea corallina]